MQALINISKSAYKEMCEHGIDNVDLKQKNIDIQDVEKIIEAFKNVSQPLPSLSKLLPSDTKELIRTPVEIKNDIKHEKNPMRLKQLNRELNDSYKAYRFGKGRKR